MGAPKKPKKKDAPKKATRGRREIAMGGPFFVEKGGIIHHEGKAIPTMGTCADRSLVEGYLCDAQQHGIE